MITIYDQKKVNIRWEVFKSVNNVHEDFSQAEVWMFLIADEHKYPLHTALDGNFVTATIDGVAFAPGSYSAVLMWLKNPETSKDLTRTELDNIFALTPYEDEDTSRVEGDVTVTLKSMVATYGYDGLDAYERAIMLGRFWGSEEEWMQSLGDHDLANYYTKGEVDELIENVEVDLTDYYTKGQTDAKISEAAGGLRQAVQQNTDDIETAKTDITDMGRTVSDHTTAIGQNTEDIAADSERILANEGNISSLQGSMTSMGGRVSTLETKVDNFVGLNQSNYKGMFSDVNSLPSMTEIGWAWVGTDMTAMAVYVWFNATDGWTRYGSNSYDLTDYSGVASQLAQIGSELDDLDYTINALRIDETASAVSGTAFEKKYNVSIPSGTVIKFKISDGSMFQNGTAGFRINGSQVDVITTDEKSYTTQSHVSEISVVKSASSVIGTGSFDIIISAGSPLIDDVNALMTSEQLRSETLVNVVDLRGKLTLFAENSFVSSNGSITSSNGYNVYKLLWSDVQNKLLAVVAAGGSGIALIYGYDSNGVPVKPYFVTSSAQKKVEMFVEKETLVSYLLFSTSTSYQSQLKILDCLYGPAFDVPLAEKESISNKLSMWQQTPDDTHYPSEKLVKDSLDNIVVISGLNSALTLFAENSAIATNGQIVTANGYTLYKLDMSGVPDNAIIEAALKTSGRNLSLAYGYDNSDGPVKSYFNTPTSGTYKFNFRKEIGVSYVLFSKTNAYNEFSISQSVPGSVIQSLVTDDVVEHHIQVLPSGTGDESLIGVLKALMEDTGDERPSESHRYIIELSEGTYNVDCSAETLSSTSGLIIMPYTTIKGKGMKSTILQFLYSGTNDDIMSKYSGLNAPYTCKIQDLTVEVENIRYTIHSDGGALDTNNTVIEVENVALIHLGINNGVIPTFNLPSAWGGGTFNGNHLRFENCRFESYQCCPFSNHDRTGLVASSYFDFVNCDFISHAPANSYVSFNTKEVGVLLNSWGSNVPIYCNFINCRMNRHISLIATTTQGNANAVNDYYVKVDNDQTVVAVQSTNDSNKTRHYSTSACREMLFPYAQSLGTPVRMFNLLEGRAYTSSSQVCYGILLHDVAANEIGVVMHKGLIPTTNLLTGTFTVGKTYGWNSGAWVEDNEYPILKVVSNQICEIL